MPPRPAITSVSAARRAALCALLLLLALAPAPARAQAVVPPHPSAAAPGVPAPVPEALDSPRASVRRYLALCKADEYADAATYLDLPDNRKGDAALLARRLKVILDRQIWVDLETLSPLALGKADDKLAAGVEEIGTIPTRAGAEPVRLVRRSGPEGMRWIFSRATVEKIDDWYGQLRDRWIQDILPAPLLRTGPKELMWWQWIALPLLFGAALALGRLLAFFIHRLLVRLTARTKAQWDDRLVARLGGPLNLVCALLVMELSTPWLGLYPPAEAYLGRVIHAGFFLSMFWIALRAVDAIGERALALPATKENPAARSLIPLGARAAKIIVAALAALSFLSELGYPVTSLVAGLGIGGVVLALAAQKTVENLFGSLAIGVDQPFRVGDFIAVDTIQGTVESIGLRSTRIRTADRTFVTLPNGKLADMRIESFAERDRIRFACILNLSRATPPETLRALLARIRSYFLTHERVFPEVTVNLVKLGESSFDVEITVWFMTRSADELATLREEALLQLLTFLAEAGVELAYPTRSIHVPKA
jgi:MscS family membrane protein